MTGPSGPLQSGEPGPSGPLQSGRPAQVPAVALSAPVPSLARDRFDDAVRSLERARIVEALNQAGGNQTQAAKLLGISRRTLVTRLGELDLPRPRKGSGDE